MQVHDLACASNVHLGRKGKAWTGLSALKETQSTAQAIKTGHVWHHAHAVGSTRLLLDAAYFAYGLKRPRKNEAV